MPFRERSPIHRRTRQGSGTSGLPGYTPAAPDPALESRLRPRIAPFPQLRRAAVAVAVGGALLAGCAGPPGGAAATVNGTTISEADFERSVRAQSESEQSPIAGLEGEERVTQLAELQRQVLTQLIRVELLRDVAADRGIEVTEADIQDRWEQEIALQGGDEQALLDLIASLGLTEEQAREQLGVQVLQEKLRESMGGDVEVSDEQVRQLFEERASQFERADVSHILVQDEAEANAIIDLLEQGQSFEELAETRSIDEGSAVQGGNLGVRPRGTYVEPFEEAVWTAEEGDIIGPVETQFGYHVIRVNEFVTQTFEDVEQSLRDELVSQQADAAFQELIRSLFDEAEVSVDSRFGQWDPATGQVVVMNALAPRSDPLPTQPAGS